MIDINKINIRTWSMLGPRGAFGKIVYDLACLRDDFLVMSADLGGSSGLKRFMEVFPERFFNAGIAEQNMIGIGAGIAKEGIQVFATSFAPFISMRGCEQMRIDAGYMHTNVRAVGLGSGVSMGYLGNSHYGLEDLAIMRAIPDMTVLSPADGVEIAKTVEASLEWDGPIYIRLTGEANHPIVYKTDYDFEIGKGICLLEGTDAVIFTTGSMVYESLKAAEIIATNGVSAAVVNMHTIKPLDQEIVRKYASIVNTVVTVEEHSVIGGLGSAVSEVISTSNTDVKLFFLGLPDKFIKAASYSELLKQHGLTGEGIAQQILANLNS